MYDTKHFYVTFYFSVPFLMVIKYEIALSLKYSKTARANIVYFMYTVN